MVESRGEGNILVIFFFYCVRDVYVFVFLESWVLRWVFIVFFRLRFLEGIYFFIFRCIRFFFLVSFVGL